MRWRLIFAILVVGVSPSPANEPPERRKDDAWIEALHAAEPAFAACRARAVAAGVWGDVELRYDDRSDKLTVAASRSLGKLARELERCVHDALAPKVNLRGAVGYEHEFKHEMRLGTPRAVLPDAKLVLPLWRRAAGTGKDAEAARRELGKLAPADYTVSSDGCFQTTSSYAHDAEYLWLPSAGEAVPRIWEAALSRALGHPIHVAMWDPAGAFVVTSDRGLCYEPFDATRQAALRKVFDTAGACWSGSFTDILLHPHVEFPADRTYTQVATHTGRACAVTTTGEVVCCGRVEPVLPAPPSNIKAIAIGTSFACALDKKSEISCWGAIDAPPTGTFSQVSATTTHACAVRTSGELACWGKGNYGVASPPKGTFVAVTAADFSSCGVHQDGSVECWGEGRREAHPPGKYTAIAGDWTHVCALRKDHLAACWSDEGGVVDLPLPDALQDVVVGDAFHVCGRRSDGSVACSGSHPNLPSAIVRPPPHDKLVQIAGDHDQFCGVRDDGRVTCWGETWPGTWQGDNTWKWPQVLGLAPSPGAGGTWVLTGRVVDETGHPIANAEVLACRDDGPCASIEHQARASPATLADLAALVNARAGTFAIATTASDGSWSATLSGVRSNVELLATAPGRELRVGGGSPDLAAHDLVLRPAATLDLDATCDGSPCTGKMMTVPMPYHGVAGTHLERMAPGTYRLEVRSDAGTTGARRGTVTVEVGYAAKPARVPVKLQRI